MNSCPSDSVVQLTGVSKSFTSSQGSVKAVQDVSIQVCSGEFVTILGPSGSGKSTLFNIVSGLISADEGQVLIKGATQTKPWQHLSYMPQKDLLLPWYKVIHNVTLSLTLAGVPKQQAYQEAMGLMDVFGLTGFENHYPAQLSGGMRQRAALMRTILAKKDIILLDEPFGALDAITRFKLQTWLLDLYHRFNTTVIFITHDVEEAIYLSDRIYVLSERPGSIKLEINVELPRPRHPQLVTQEAFVQLKKVLLQSLTY